MLGIYVPPKKPGLKAERRNDGPKHLWFFPKPKPATQLQFPLGGNIMFALQVLSRRDKWWLCNSVRNCSNLPDAFKIASPAASLQDRNKHRCHNHEEKNKGFSNSYRGLKIPLKVSKLCPMPRTSLQALCGGHGLLPRAQHSPLALCCSHYTVWERWCFINCLLSCWAGKGRACFVLKETTKCGVIKLLRLTMLSVSHCLVSYKTQQKI